MRCAFCGYDFGDEKSPPYCRGCNAGLEGLTEGQMVSITEQLKSRRRGSRIGAILGSVMLGVGALFILLHLGWPWIVGAFALAVVGYAFCIKEHREATEMDWMLTRWGKQKQAAKPESKEMQTKDIDSAEAIRKLAELRDQGVLTQDEFEQKKKKLL
jgi:hypothetical protein